MIPIFPVLRAAVVAGVLSFGLAAVAQAVAPQVPGAPPPVATPAAAGEAKIVKSEVERKGRTGFDTFLATYLTLSKECKIGANPKIDVTVPPKNGKINIRPNAINLRSVPGAPKTNCIGVSPSGVGVFYRAERKFRGEDSFTYRVIYPTGDIREVTAKVITQ